MAFQFRGKRSKKKGTALRLTGLFKSKTRGLYVGGVTELDDLKLKVRKAMTEDKGLVFFLWKNDPDGEGPPYTLSMDVSKDDDEDRPRGGKKHRPEPEDDEPEDEPEEADSDEVPF